jgi:GNAT superfamily N-acetyltransferase
MEIHLRKATENDLQTILDILNNGTRNKVRRGDLAWGMSDHNPETVNNMIGDGLFYLALSESTPVGIFALSWQDDHMWGKQPLDAGYVQRFAVAAGYSGQDVGGQILHLALKEIESHGRSYLRIAVPSGNAKLRTYYENHGFTRAEYRITSVIHPAYAAAYYERAQQSQAETVPTSIKQKSLFKKLFQK